MVVVLPLTRSSRNLKRKHGTCCSQSQATTCLFFITDTRFPLFISSTSNTFISFVFFNPPTYTLMALMYLYLALLCFGSILYYIYRHVETCREALAAAFESPWWLNFARFGHIQFISFFNI